MRGWVKTLGVVASLLAVFTLSGGHWLALQGIAWGRMMADFSTRDSLVVAVGKTFDGEHPCPMCIKIRAGRAEEQRSKPADSGVAAPRAPDVSQPPASLHIPFVSCAPALHRTESIGCPEPPASPPLTPPPQA